MRRSVEGSIDNNLVMETKTPSSPNLERHELPPWSVQKKRCEKSHIVFVDVVHILRIMYTGTLPQKRCDKTHIVFFDKNDMRFFTSFFK